MIKHWDGVNWQRVTSPSPRVSHVTALADIDAVAADDVWAVGIVNLETSKTEGLIQRWDGTKWSITDVVKVRERYGSQLEAISADATTDAWAVGEALGTGGSSTLILHWNGITWERTASPSPSGATLTSMSARSPTDVWAVGSMGFNSKTLVLHYDGHRWSRVSSPNPPSKGDTYLNGVTALGPRDVWAVGNYDTRRTGTPSAALVEHWDGESWSLVAAPSPGGPDSSTYLRDISAVGHRDVWAVGDYVPRPVQGLHRTLVERWNGNRWTKVASPNKPGAPSDSLEGVSARSGGDAWAVGSAASGCMCPTPAQPGSAEPGLLIEHWNGNRWHLG